MTQIYVLDRVRRSRVTKGSTGHPDTYDLRPSAHGFRTGDGPVSNVGLRFDVPVNSIISSVEKGGVAQETSYPP